MSDVLNAEAERFVQWCREIIEEEQPEPFATLAAGGLALAAELERLRSERDTVAEAGMAHEQRLRDDLAAAARAGGCAADLAETAVQALLPVLPLVGSWDTGYRVSEHIHATVVATPEEWATAALAVAELHAHLDRAVSGQTAEKEEA